MNKYMQLCIVFAAPILIVWLIQSFYFLSFSPVEWGSEGRATALMLMAIGEGLVIALTCEELF
jgi:hypothetical protein